jgi:hypothetical protein
MYNKNSQCLLECGYLECNTFYPHAIIYLTVLKREGNKKPSLLINLSGNLRMEFYPSSYSAFGSPPSVVMTSGGALSPEVPLPAT